MRALVLEQTANIESSPLQLAELPDPQPGAGEVRLRVRCCGICRTDLHVIEGELPRHRLPLVPGHQIVGEVDELGPECAHLRVGQRVGVAWLRETCGECRFCQAGRENLCQASRFTGYDADGGYADYAVVPEAFAYEIPDAFEDAEAAPLLCAGIIGYHALRRCNLPDGGKLALYGFGASAHIVAQIALHRGCELYVVSRTEAHLDFARELGAKWAGTKAAQMPIRADGAIIFAPAGHLVPQALEQLEHGGTLALAGIYMTAVPSLDYERHLFHERDVHSVTSNTREDGRALLTEAAQVPVRPRITRFDLADANRALQALKSNRINGSGVLVT